MARPAHRRRRGRAVRAVWTAVGVALCAAGSAILAHIHLYESHSTAAAATLVRTFNSPGPLPARPGATAPTCSAAPPSAPTAGAHMVLAVPAIGLIAPVLGDSTDSSLNVAVGHLPTSAWPDQGGTDVLEAHDVTFFRNIDRLRPGARILLHGHCLTWDYRVTVTEPVIQGAALPPSPGPRVALVTCWPTNALFYTNRRYVVEAALQAVLPYHARPADQPAIPPTITASLPPAVAAMNLDPTREGVPMGTMSASGPFNSRWLSSSAPLQATGAGEQLLGAALLAAREQKPAWWHVVAPALPWSADIPLAQPIQWASPVNVTIYGAGDTPTRVTLAGGVSLAGRYIHLQLGVTIAAGTATISTLSLTP